MKNLSIILFVATIINNNLFAQTKADSVKIYKNEIGWNVLPLFNLNKEGNDYIPTFNVFYKRAIKNNWYGRASIITFVNYNSGKIYFEKVKGLPNSKLSIEYIQHHYNDFAQYNLGVEKRFGKEKLKMFTGVDLGYSNQKSEDRKIYTIRDSIFNNSLGGYPADPNSQISHPDSTVSHFKKTSNSLIFTPFYGVQFNISKHFLFSAQFGVALSIEKQTNNTIVDNAPNNYYLSSITNFGLNLNAASSNFSICYRF